MKIWDDWLKNNIECCNNCKSDDLLIIAQYYEKGLPKKKFKCLLCKNIFIIHNDEDYEADEIFDLAVA